MSTGTRGRGLQPGWRRLRENPDYVADWRAHAGPMVREPPPYVFRRQTVADLTAARWNLLAWENPHEPQWATLFWADAPMVGARAAEPGLGSEYSWRRLLHRAEARFVGLRLLDGALVLKVSRAGETVYIRVIDGAAFDPARSGLEVATPSQPRRRERWVALRSLDPIVFRYAGAPPRRPRGA